MTDLLIFNLLWTSFPAMEAVGAAETRHGEWSVTRLRSAAHGTASIESLGLGVGPRGGLGEQGDSVSRLLVLTNTSLVERRPENYEVEIFSLLYEFVKLLYYNMDILHPSRHWQTKTWLNFECYGFTINTPVSPLNSFFLDCLSYYP